MVDTSKPLLAGCWLPREDPMKTWVEFRYGRLQDFCQIGMWRGMCIKERWLMMERALSAVDELVELLGEYQELWDILEHESMVEGEMLLERLRGKYIPRGNDWPQSTARSP